MSYAQIVTFDEYDKIRLHLGHVVCTSGGYDPLHPGHTSCIIESSKFGSALVVVVNGDWFLRNKKGKAFMDLKTRCHLISCIREVDYVIPFEIENDSTVCEALKRIKPNIFTKGGDRFDFTTIPEWKICEEMGTSIITGVGLKKDWSSSDLLHDWGEYWKSKT